MDISSLTVDRRPVADFAEADLRRIHELGRILHVEARPEDPYSPFEQMQAQLSHLPDFAHVELLVATGPGDEIVGSAEAVTLDQPENRHLVHAQLSVHPDHRRQGVGSRLLGEMVDFAGQHGRTLFITGTNDRVPAGDAFARRVGAEAGMRTHTNRLDLTTVDRDLVKRWVDEGPGRAPDYHLEVEEGACSDGRLDDLVEMMRVMNDAPRDDLDMEDFNFTAEQLRQMEAMSAAGGIETWRIFAVHDATDRAAGFTDVTWNPSKPKTVSQGNTGVHPDHRGHGLGKWLKAAMIDKILVERPQAIDIRTGNADSNEAMLGINHALGFEPYIAETVWQLRVDQAQAYLAQRAP